MNTQKLKQISIQTVIGTCFYITHSLHVSGATRVIHIPTQQVPVKYSAKRLIGLLV